MTDAPYHVLPTDDLREHEVSATCWCRPQAKDGGAVIVHNSLDRREMYEHSTN